MRDQCVQPRVDQLIAALAKRQHGVVEHGQLLRLGLSRHAIWRRVQAGLLHPLHRGVYAVGHLHLSGHSHLHAAVLAIGSAAVLSHHSAADLWGIRRSAASTVHVTTHRGGRQRRRRITVHTTTSLPPDERAERDGIPVTSVARTLLDEAELLRPDALARALRETEVQRLFDLHALRAVIAAHPGRRGGPRLRRALDAVTEPDGTRNDFERDLLALVRRARLPAPLVNAPVAPYVVDFLWPAQRLVVEADGYATHGTRSAFERDRRRDTELRVRGYTVLRFTHRQVVREPAYVTRVLRAMLAP